MTAQRFPFAARIRAQGVLPLARLGAVLSLALLLAVVPGCRLLQTPQNLVTAVVPAGRSRQPDPVDLQLQVQRFADDYSIQITAALEEYARRVGTEAARAQALGWKLAATTAAISIASGPQPKASLLDLVSLATLNRAAVEAQVAASADGPALQLWLEASRALETNAWSLAASKLSPAQVTELRQATAAWQAQNPEARSLFAARPLQFASMVKTSQKKQGDINSVFSLVGLDPTSGLDPAVREVTLTRLFAERAMFAMQRMPTLLRWQADLMAHDIARQPGVQMALTNTARFSESMDRLSHAAESVSQTAAQLPDQIAAERKAILATLEQQEGRLRELAAEVNHALVAANQMAGSLTVTITNFDALMKRFGVGEPDTNAAPDTNSPPFNILDYAKTAAQIENMAKELNGLITSVNQSVPQIERLSQQAGTDVQRVVDRAFRLGLVLIGVLLIGAVLAGLAYRVLANKLGPVTLRSGKPGE